MLRGWRGWGLTWVAMVAFASNSLLCRAAIRGGHIDPMTFTAVRLCAGALVLSPLALRARGPWLSSVPSAVALFAYAAAFSMAYLRLSAGLGALLLFGMVQVSMLAIGRMQGQRLSAQQAQGAALAAIGLVALTLPIGVTASLPPLRALLFMAAAGVAWGIYSVRGRSAGDPTTSTARNFLWSAPMVLLWWATQASAKHFNLWGVVLAAVSGALSSGLGYVIWYAALKHLRPVEAALVQLSVPVITAVAGVLFMGEAITLRLMIAGSLILSGIAWASVRA